MLRTPVVRPLAAGKRAGGRLDVDVRGGGGGAAGANGVKLCAFRIADMGGRAGGSFGTAGTSGGALL